MQSRSTLHHECFAREAACAGWRKENVAPSPTRPHRKQERNLPSGDDAAEAGAQWENTLSYPLCCCILQISPPIRHMRLHPNA